MSLDFRKLVMASIKLVTVDPSGLILESLKLPVDFRELSLRGDICEFQIAT